MPVPAWRPGQKTCTTIILPVFGTPPVPEANVLLRFTQPPSPVVAVSERTIRALGLTCCVWFAKKAHIFDHCQLASTDHRVGPRSAVNTSTVHVFCPPPPELIRLRLLLDLHDE